MAEATCHKHRSAEDPPSFWQNGDAVFQAHHVGWIISGTFAAVATGVSFWLIDKHLQWYTNKKEQRYIVRLLFLVPIYAIISFASFLFWNQSTPLILVRDAYEAIVLTAFFYLLLNYLSPDPEEQKRVFLKAGLSQVNDAARLQRGEKLQKWMWPMGFVKWKPKDGLYFLQLMKWGILQYCVIRPVATLVAVILDYVGLYCESSWAPGWGHLWIVLIISVSVTIAMYCLLQLYFPVDKQLKPHRPVLKLFAVKAVVFLTFWQATFLSLLSLVGVVKDGKYMTAEDINIGIRALLETFEMMIFAFLHVKAFTYKPYRPYYNTESKDSPPNRTPRLRSLGHVLDFRETFREIWIGCIYLFDKMRGREPTPDFGVRRAAHYEEAFGRPRPSVPPQKAARKSNAPKKMQKPRPGEPMDITINQQVEVEVGGERQWLGIGDDYGYGLGYFRRERSEGLSAQIEKELQNRGYSSDSVQGIQDAVPPERGQPSTEQVKRRRSGSWWRNLYDRISQTGHEDDTNDTSLTPSMPRRLQSKPTRSRRHSEMQRSLLQDTEHDLNDPPPVSSFRRPTGLPVPVIRQTPSSGNDYASGQENDVLAPLSSYRERRRSYRPRRQRGDSSSALLPQPSPPSPPPHSNPDRRSDGEHHHDMRELGVRQPHEFLSIPASNNRSDSLLNRLFPPSEAGSMNDLTRETDSGYSMSVGDHHLHQPRGLPSTTFTGGRFDSSSSLEGVTGDKRLQVLENVVHPSRSMAEMHTPWTADIIGLHSQTSLNPDQPPVPPAKDYIPLPPRRSHRRESAHHLSRDMDTDSLPSLPEGVQFIPPQPSESNSFRLAFAIYGFLCVFL
ncbi:DUF300 domain-containing protein [Coprinopsis cinerea AmutBmut pab1-1]|nr:DUF300 domain-containing protein [Coprinopsis cinerea AmutBmut pab1-1]